MKMQRIPSFLSLARVAAWVIAIAVAINFVALSLDGTRAMQWLSDRQTGVGFLIESKQRVDAARAAYRSGAVRDDTYLGAIVGISNVREGISIDVMLDALGNHWRLIGIAGAGAGTPSTAEQAGLLLKSELRPDLVVLGISPMHLLDPLVDPVRSRTIAAEAPRRSRIEQVKAAARQALWLINRRSDLRAWFDRQLMDARAAVQAVISLDTAVQDSRSPWRPMLSTIKETTPTEAIIESSLAWARLFGANDRNAYEQSKLGPQIGANMIRDFTEKGACVMVVMMPEHSRLRALEPPDIGKFVESRLRIDSGIAELNVVDLREAAADPQFNDLVHLNNKGSRMLSMRLAAAIDQLAINGPPLMALQGAGKQVCRYIPAK